ncbi:hypothetical protein FB446DRAFT_704140 [Lentinula raphanica]|nr:hypothetical protein FB446DRAFT_704140 [Lentinula raphanica]
MFCGTGIQSAVFLDAKTTYRTVATTTPISTTLLAGQGKPRLIRRLTSNYCLLSEFYSEPPSQKQKQVLTSSSKFPLNTYLEPSLRRPLNPTTFDMRPVVINLGLSLLMASTWAMPVSDHIQTSTTNARETQPAHVYISNLGVIPNAKLFKYVEAGIQWTASQHKDWGFPDKFEVVQTPVVDHFDRAYVNREDGSHEFSVRLETDFRILNLRDPHIGWGRIKIARETSDTEFLMKNWKTEEYVTIGDKIRDVMMFEDVDSQVGNIAVIERGKNLVDEETEEPQKKKFWKCCFINPHRREFTRRTTASRLVKLLEHLQTIGHHASTATVHDEFTRFWLLDIKTLKTRIGTVHHATMVRNETFESAAVGILSGFLLTAPRAVLTKRQHAIQFDQPTFPRPESFDGLNLGHASESCHAIPKIDFIELFCRKKIIFLVGKLPLTVVKVVLSSSYSLL